MQFKKATKAQSRARIATFGPSGGGKTMTALRIATGLVPAGKRVALIDSERGSASKYADRFDFDALDLDKKTIAEYVQAIAAAGSAGYGVLVIDSLSHAWQELLVEVDRLASTKFKGNTWSAWSEGTPKQRSLVDAILSCPCHVIVTMRSKTEWTQEQTGNGKTRPIRVGLAPEQGKGIEYEFDLLLELSQDHIATVIKDRTGKYQDKIIDKPGEDFGRELAAWLSEGESPPAARGPDAPNTGPGTDSAAPPAPALATKPAQLDDIRKRLRDRIFQKCQGEIESSRDLFHSLCESVLNHKFKNADELNMAQCRMLLEAIEK